MSCYLTDGMELLISLPNVCNIRSEILSFLPSTDILAAARIHEHWYEAATASHSWSAAFSSSPSQILKCCERTFTFDVPVMYVKVLDAAVRVGSLIASLNNDEKSCSAGGELFGSSANRYHVNYPALHIAIRLKSHWGLREAVATFDIPPGEVYERLWLMWTQVMRVHLSHPEQGDVWWLLSFYDWAACSFQGPFHRLMLAPALFLLRVRSCHISDVVAERLIECTTRLLKKYSYIDPVPLFGVLVHVLYRLPHLRSPVLRAIVSYPNGLAVFDQAKTTVDGLLLAHHMRIKYVMHSATPDEKEHMDDLL